MTTSVMAIAQQKGGVGKTTTCINLGAALIERGKRVLVVDLDPQGALTAGLGLNPLGIETTVYNALRESKLSFEKIILTTESGMDLAPANIDLSAAEIELIAEPGRERILEGKFLKIRNSYDYILIDCPPSLGLLTLNALAASSRCLIPVQTQYFALRGMDLLFQLIQKVQERINPTLKVAGILPTMFDSRTLHSKEVLDELKSVYGSLLCRSVIPHTVRLQDSNMAGQSILRFASPSQAATAYRQLAEEIEHE